MKTINPTYLLALHGLLIGSLATSFADAQNQTWIRQLGTIEHDTLRTSVPDGAGGAFVGGETVGALGGPVAGSGDVWFARYDRAGVRMWIRQLGTPDGEALTASAPDRAGGVYVGGNTSGDLGATNIGGFNTSDAWLAHYNLAGNQTWIRQFGTTDTDNLTAASPDGVGGVFVAGTTYGTMAGPVMPGENTWLARYDAAGNQLWIQQFGSLLRDHPTAIIPDGMGGLFLSGNTLGTLGSQNIGSQDAWVARYDGAGNRMWLTQFGSVAGEESWDLAPDGQGGLFICGYTFGDLGGINLGGHDAWLARFDGAGSQTWMRQIATPWADAARALASDGLGGVFISGTTVGDLVGANTGTYDCWVANYNAGGNRVWLEQFGGQSADVMTAASPDGWGGVYVSGYTASHLTGQNAGSNDAWIARYGKNGPRPYCGPANFNSTGLSGELNLLGSVSLPDNDLTLRASQLPPNVFGYFLAGQTQAFIPLGNGQQGVLCLAVGFGSFTGPGQVQNSGPNGILSLPIDLNSMPTPQGSVAIQFGETWNFQAWHRDHNPASTTNFTDAVEVFFQ